MNTIYNGIIFTDSEQVETEKPDNELIWNIHLISQVCSILCEILVILYSRLKSDFEWKG